MYAIVTQDKERGELFYCQYCAEGFSRWVEVNPYYEDCPANALLTRAQMEDVVALLSAADSKLKVTILTYEVPQAGFLCVDKNIQKIKEEINK